jgi:gamma-glutamyl-gamma-aminobutyrate hydrolase PuuD
MMETSSLLEKSIERVLEMSADLQIQRLATAKYSLAFHDYSVAIAAYGKVLAILTKLQEQEDCSASMELLGSLEMPGGTRAVLS